MKTYNIPKGTNWTFSSELNDAKKILCPAYPAKKFDGAPMDCSQSDLDAGHGTHETVQSIRHTINENGRREVLASPLQLNPPRYEEEVKLGLHEKKGKIKKKQAKKESPQEKL
jgi:hypothetical protein